METISIPLREYNDLLELYKKISHQMERIETYRQAISKPQSFNAWKYCGVISLTEDALTIQKEMRNEWD